MFGLLSAHPEYSSKVKPFIALAPVAHVGNIKTPVKYLAYISGIDKILTTIGGEILPNSLPLKIIKTKICSGLTERICGIVMDILYGPDPYQRNTTRIRVYASHDPSGTSKMNLAHFAQLVVSHRFARYDYGPLENIRKYGSGLPPEYLLENINSPNIALLYGANDYLADPADVNILRKRLKGTKF